MANIFPAFEQVHPSFMMPELVIQYAQASGFTESLAGGNVQPKLSEGDLFVYGKALELRTQIAAGQISSLICLRPTIEAGASLGFLSPARCRPNSTPTSPRSRPTCSPASARAARGGSPMPAQTIVAHQFSSPTYLLRARAEYDHHDTQQAGVWGVALPEAQRLAMRQAIFQQTRTAALFGMGPSDQGITNTSGATTVNLPADSNGNTTVSTYDNGQMALFLLGQIAALKTRTNLMGVGVRINILTTQEILGAWDYQGVVQLTQYQRAGAGVATTAEMVAEIAKRQGDEVTFTCDDTLKGAGAGGTDLIIMNMPEVKKPSTQSRINTNVFADLQPSMAAATLQLSDMVAPKEIQCPLPGGAVDVLSEMRITPGWTIRPETLTLISAGF